MSDTVYVVEFAPVASPSDAEFPACVYVRAADVVSAREWVAAQPGCHRVGTAVKLSPEQVEARPSGVSIATAETATPYEGWCITEDHQHDPSDEVPPRVGMGQSFKQRGNDYTPGMDPAACIEARPWHCFDDDGELMFSGVISRSWAEGDEESSLAPLGFAMLDVGATKLMVSGTMEVV